MTVTAVRKDPVALTMTLTAEFDASPARVWELWADPRQLERWWGPPTYPATFTAHDLAPGSHVEYHMTGPSGDQPHGYWDIVEASDILKQQYDALPVEERKAIRDEVALFARDFQGENGLAIPHDYLIATGSK